MYFYEIDLILLTFVCFTIQTTRYRLGNYKVCSLVVHQKLNNKNYRLAFNEFMVFMRLWNGIHKFSEIFNTKRTLLYQGTKERLITFG